VVAPSTKTGKLQPGFLHVGPFEGEESVEVEVEELGESGGPVYSAWAFPQKSKTTPFSSNRGRVHPGSLHNLSGDRVPSDNPAIFVIAAGNPPVIFLCSFA
jgi:hypothetical protein